MRPGLRVYLKLQTLNPIAHVGAWPKSTGFEGASGALVRLGPE